ncbi:hypothetical protein L484_028075 [Morus notabilis]|uniref:Uncharacterized protein n=1 Tax=Morus notabilis TaxID=981085 RepID=W9S827_9ROSA|nr:hypothetical protein L484_028075 [Morus notabilis]
MMNCTSRFSPREEIPSCSALVTPLEEIWASSQENAVEPQDLVTRRYDFSAISEEIVGRSLFDGKTRMREEINLRHCVRQGARPPIIPFQMYVKFDM